MECELYVISWDADVDMAALNHALAQDDSIASLYEEVSQLANFKGMFHHTDGHVHIYDPEGRDYRSGIEVWQCFDEDTMEIIAPFVKSGKIVLRTDSMDSETKYWVIEPNLIRPGNVTVS